MDIRRLQHYFVILAIISVPAFSGVELVALFLGKLRSLQEPLTPPAVKIIKDLILVAIGFLGILALRHRALIALPSVWVMFFLAVFFSMLWALVSLPLIAVLAGLRFVMPILLLPLVFACVDERLQRQVSTALAWMMLFALLMQILQLFFAPSLFGHNSLGLNLRNPGIYIVPASMASFAVVSMYYIAAFGRRTLFNRMMVLLICPLSVLLTASGAGVMGVFLVLGAMFVWSVKERDVLTILLAPLPLLAFSLIPLVTDRDDFFESGFDRLRLLSYALKTETAFLSMEFGLWTNAAITAMKVAGIQIGETARIADSTITSMIGNTGMLGFAAFICMIAAAYTHSRKFHLFLAGFLPFMLSSNITETFPINILFVVSLAYMYKYKYSLYQASDRVVETAAGSDAERLA